MEFFTNAIKTVVLPFKLFKKKYLPFIIIYLAYGFAFFISIPQTFWVKDFLKLTPVELIQITFWTTAPWTMKMFFSQFIENISIAGSRRKSYIAIGALINLLGNLIIIAMSNHHPWVKVLGSVYSQLLISGVLVISGLVLQDMIADTLCAELADRTDKHGNKLSDEQIKYEVGAIQLLGRMALMFALFAGTFIGGLLASHYKFSDITWFSLIIPFFSLLAAYFLRTASYEKEGVLDVKIVFMGSVLVFASILSEMITIPYNQEIIFLINLVVLVTIFKMLSKNMSSKNIKEITLIAIMIFAARLTPETGAGVDWWKIDVLKFDPQFISILAQLNYVLGFFGTWLISNYLLRKDISITIIIITIINAILLLPYIGMAYGLHEWTEQHFGFGAKTIAIIDMAVDGPFSIALMVPILALLTYYAPKANKVTWFAFGASWFNLSLSGQTLISKYLNLHFVIERGNYQYVPHVIVSCMAISFILPLITVYFCNKFRGGMIDKKNISHKKYAVKKASYAKAS